jgi:hypothetical protein
MNKTLKKIALLASILIILFFIIFVINQTAQIVQLADKVAPQFGIFVFWALLVIYAILILSPIILFLRLPKSLSPPRTEDSPEFQKYLTLLGKRLGANQHLRGMDLSNREQIEKALSILAQHSDGIIQKAASTVFISTAISQSGRLDAFVVLLAQSRMVWRIARLYYQRPMLRELIQLYANVAGTAFLASELDDIDVSEQVEPILSSTLGALAVTVPGVQLAASILVNSVLTGTANAFLTLRVGNIAKQYCGSLIVAERRTLRRAASAEAAKMLGSIVRQGAAQLSKAVWKASKGKVSKTFSNVSGYAKEAGNTLLSRVGLRKAGEPLSAEMEGPPDTDSGSSDR